MEKSIEKIPTWALCYIVNGDQTGLTDEEVQMINDIYHRQHIELICPDYESEPYFSTVPFFGKATEVMDCTVIFHQ